MVLATQNPIEHEGTYPLPEAQLDRFIFEIRLDYPSAEEEREIVTRTTAPGTVELEKILDAAKILELQRLVRRVPAAPSVIGEAVDLVRRSRRGDPDAPETVRQWVEWGAGPRASQFLVLAAKARAIMRGSYAASVADVRAVAPSTLRHRIILNYRGLAEGIGPDDVVTDLLNHRGPIR
jgi:MoxR-like ATPase